MTTLRHCEPAPRAVPASPLNLPNALSGLRIAAAPVLALCAWLDEPRLFLAALAAALLSDVADGFVARHLGQCTPLGTRLDSWGDLLIYATAIPCVFWLWPDALMAEWPFVATAVLAFVAPSAYGAIKFHRLTSYHTYGAKLSALLVGPGTLALLALGHAGLFRVAVLVLALSAVEEMAITWRLPAWRAEIRGLWDI